MHSRTLPRSLAISVLSLVAVVFGLMTIKEGGTALFGGRAAEMASVNVVPFVLWFNFLAGFAYVAAGIGLWFTRCWAVWLAIAIAGATACTFAALGVHILDGRPYELRTVMAMVIRTLIWVTIAGVAFRALLRVTPSISHGNAK